MYFYLLTCTSLLKISFEAKVLIDLQRIVSLFIGPLLSSHHVINQTTKVFGVLLLDTINIIYLFAFKIFFVFCF